MSLEKISQQLGNQNSKNRKIPPVELWNPPFCGDIDLNIASDGSWYYQGTPFKRMSLVKLFASVLKKENGKHYLVTPVEKIGITVEDAPFLITQWQWLDNDKTRMQVTTNMDDEFTLDANHPMTISDSGNLYITVRADLQAKVHRNVYYQWVDIAEEIVNKNGTELVFISAEQKYILGNIEA